MCYLDGLRVEREVARRRETKHTNPQYSFIWMHTQDHMLIYMYIYYNDLRFQ